MCVCVQCYITHTNALMLPVCDIVTNNSHIPLSKTLTLSLPI